VKFATLYQKSIEILRKCETEIRQNKGALNWFYFELYLEEFVKNLRDIKRPNKENNNNNNK
jgi:hypothetical protein